MQDLVISTNILPEEINTKRVSSYKTLATISEFEQHINGTPRIYKNLYVDELSVAFNPAALNVFKKLLTNGFINIETLYYITLQPKQNAIQVFENIFENIKFEIVDVKSIDTNTVTSVVNGSLSGSVEQSYSVINKVKLKDYVGADKAKKLVDVQEDIIDESMIVVKDSLHPKAKKTIINIINFDRYYTAYYVLMIYNNLKRNQKVFTMEFDKYNFLSDYIVKLGDRSYIDNIDAISDTKSCLFINKNTNNSDYNALFDYIFNITKFDVYLRVVDFDNVSINSHNSHYVINPVVDNIIKLLEILYKSNAKVATVVLLYKGFIGINELKPFEVKQLLNSHVQTDIDISSIVIKEGN